MDRLIIAPADKISGSDFFRAVMGKPPLTAAEKAEREAEKRRRMAEMEAQHQRELMELRKRILRAYPTDEGRAAAIAKWAAEGVDVTQLTECLPDPMPRRAA